MYSKDDPVALYEDFPRDMALSNPNCLLVESEFGGHCDFMTNNGHKDLKHRRFYEKVVIKYIHDLDKI